MPYLGTAITRIARREMFLFAAVVLVGTSVAIGPVSAIAHRRVHAPPGCRDPYPARRNPANPLMLPGAPGSNPLNGARFFVDGPRHGSAARAIARLLHVNPNHYPDNFSWARFKSQIEKGRLHRRLVHHRGLAWRVRMLEKIADQPEPQRFSSVAYGGGPGAAYAQATKIFCHNLTADPGSIPIITTYFLHPDLGTCPSGGRLAAQRGRFKRSIDEMVAATARRPAVYLLELDAIGSSCGWHRRGDFAGYLGLFRYEIRKVSALPHTVVYAEAGYSDSHSPTYTARALNRVGIRGIRGFFTNDTHENWTINEVRWADKVSRMTHGAHFIVNTAQNGRGPKHNRHPVRQGNNELCNPPRRGIGPMPTTHTGFPLADAFLWMLVPGESTGHCHGGPANGVYWPARSIQLAALGTGSLGP
jgi:hypothetical protein